jgi:pyruvate dehydrogenase E2 component (dihydrolipoamide acetyltransferase)
MREAIAAAMARAKREIPHYYLALDIDFGAPTAWLESENARVAPADRLVHAALLLKAVGLAAKRYPMLNGFYEGGAFRASEKVHVGVAISLREGGLVAPAIHDVPDKPLGVVMKELSALVQRVRAGRVRASELSDPTITVSNLGAMGVGVTFPIIHPPQVAIVGFGRVEERPWVVDGEIVARPVVAATLAGDHRASDGHQGALFLRTVDRLLQHPEEL